MLEIKNIHKSFGDVRVLNGVNLCLEKGFVCTFKGGNSTGKTTLVSIISDLHQAIQMTVYENILLVLEKRRCLLWIQ